jgi:hypothetical protein
MGKNRVEENKEEGGRLKGKCVACFTWEIE